MAKPTSKSLEVLDYVISSYLLFHEDPRKPGAVIARLPKKMREELQKLSSDDALVMRPENWWNKMGDPRNPARAKEEWDVLRLEEMRKAIEALPDYVVLSGGWAWHYMSPPHREFKVLHDHKDVDLFVLPGLFGELASWLSSAGYVRIWTRFDKVSREFYRYEKHAEGGTKILLDVFLGDVPCVQVKTVKVVAPGYLLTLYGYVHETEDCVAVRAAEKLMARGISPIGRKELVAL